jgi:tetratricopeptide (TPR) repeat protein
METKPSFILIVNLFLALRVFADYTPSEDGYKERIKYFIEAENHLGVLTFIDSLRNIDNHNSELSWYYANSLFHSGRLGQARDSLLKWEKDSLFNPRIINMLTQIAIQQKDYMEAVKYLLIQQSQFPLNPIYPHRLARVYNAINRLPEAETCYSHAHSLDNMNQNLISEWVELLVKLDFTEKAVRILDQGIMQSPGNYGFRRQKVRLAYKTGEFDQVLEHATFLVHQGDTTPQVVKLKAFVYFQKDSIDNAEFWIDYLIENGFTGEDIYFYKGKILVEKKHKHKAQEYFDLAAVSCMSANFNPFALQAGINLFETGNYQESIRWLQMTKLFSQNPMITFYLALSFYDYYEDKNPALQQFRNFLKQSTTDAQEAHREFARYKIREIIAEIHFKGL